MHTDIPRHQLVIIRWVSTIDPSRRKCVATPHRDAFRRHERSSVSGKAVPLVTGDGVVVAVEDTVTAVPVSVGLI